MGETPPLDDISVLSCAFVHHNHPDQVRAILACVTTRPTDLAGKRTSTGGGRRDRPGDNARV